MMERINAPIENGVGLNLPFVFIVSIALKCERKGCSLYQKKLYVHSNQGTPGILKGLQMNP